MVAYVVRRRPIAALEGAALDWAVAQAEQALFESMNPLLLFEVIRSKGGMRYSTDWTESGPLIQRHRLALSCLGEGEWLAEDYLNRKRCTGPTALIAAMRLYAVTQLGEAIDVPETLE